MLEVEIGDKITLDNDEKYGVVSIVNYKNKRYLYLVDCVTEKKAKFVQQEDKKLIELDNEKDKELLKKLLPIFLKNGISAFEKNTDE